MDKYGGRWSIGSKKKNPPDLDTSYLSLVGSSSLFVLGGSASALLTKHKQRRRTTNGNSFRDDSGSKLRDKEQQRLSSK